jgi:hypothetical protein
MQNRLSKEKLEPDGKGTIHSAGALRLLFCRPGKQFLHFGVH